MSRTKRIEQLERRRATLVESIAGIREMIRGSFNTVYVKCGKGNCRCAYGEGHPSDRIVFLENRRLKCRSVPRGEGEWIRRMVENRKEFRGYRQELKAIEKEIHKEISELEAEVVSRSVEKKAWLK